MYSERERVAHVVRRLGIGANPDLLATVGSVDAAIATMLTVPESPLRPPTLEPPASWEEIDYGALDDRLLPWWFEVLRSGREGLVERLTWFWHDHFAVGADKVDHPYLIWQHHALVRAHAMGSFAELLHAVATDPAMLWYLDGASNEAQARNENFGREVMELHTVGTGVYRQADIREIARAFTGWVVNQPADPGPGFDYPDAAPWAAVFEPERFDAGVKTVLGRSGALGMTEALDVLLDRPETAENITAAVFRELVGLDPEPQTRQRLARGFGSDWSIIGLVEEIVADPVFISDEAIRSRVRTPLEKAATLLQAFGPATAPTDRAAPVPELALSDLPWLLRRLHYLPLHPPNPAGFPAGSALLDPGRLFGSFDLLGLVPNLDEAAKTSSPVDVTQRLGLMDLSDQTRRMLARFPRPGLQLGLAFGSPEFIRT